MYKPANRHKSRANGLNSDIAKIKAALSHATHDMKGKAGEMLTDRWDDVKDKSYDMQEHVAEYIADKPFKAMGFALLTGFLFGFLTRK